MYVSNINTPHPSVAGALPARWHFIDRPTYNALRCSSRPLDVTDFVNLSDGISPAHNRLSLSTQEYTRMLNRELQYVLFEAVAPVRDGDNSDATAQSQYLREQLRSFLEDESGGNTAFYEILPIDGKSFLVIVESGFIQFITQSKDSLIEFVLACLGCLDRFKCDASQLNKLYLRLRLIPGFHTLVKARAQR